MKFGAIIILENRIEIRKVLKEALRRKKQGQNYDYRVEGSLPNERIDELISNLKMALNSGSDAVTLTFRE
jgi:hypothetical protein